MSRSALRKCGLVSVAILALIVLWLVAVQAQEAAPPRITLALQDKDVGEVLTQIAQQGKVKVIADSTVTGKVNLDAKDATVEAALGGICDTLKVEWRRLVVAPGAFAQMDTDQISRMIRALESASQMGLMVQNDKAKQAIATEPKKEVAAVPAGKEAVYLLFDPARQPGQFRGNRGAGGNAAGPGGFGAVAPGGAAGAGGANQNPIFNDQQMQQLRAQMQNLRDNRDPQAWTQFRAGLAGMFPQLTPQQQQQVIAEGMMHSLFQGRGGNRGRRGGPGG